MTIIKEFVDSLLSRKPVVAPPQTYKGSAFDYLRETVDANGNAIFANSLSRGESAGKESRPGASRLSEALANVQDPKAGNFTRENFMDAVRSPRPHHHKPQDIDGITLRNITNSLDRYTKERELLALDRDKIDADIRGADSAIKALTLARDLLMEDRAEAAMESATSEFFTDEAFESAISEVPLEVELSSDATEAKAAEDVNDFITKSVN